jgi:hypothetical protein
MLSRFFRVRAVPRLFIFWPEGTNIHETTVILGGAVVLYREMGFAALHICTNETVAFFTGWEDGLGYAAST